jgi:hypothetical protein
LWLLVEAVAEQVLVLVVAVAGLEPEHHFP